MCLFHQNCPLLVSDGPEWTVYVKGILPVVQTTCQFSVCSTIPPTFNQTCELHDSFLGINLLLFRCSLHFYGLPHEPLKIFFASHVWLHPRLCPSFLHFFFVANKLLHTCNWSLFVRCIGDAISKLPSFCILYALTSNLCCACDSNLACCEIFITCINIEECAHTVVIGWNWSQAGLCHSSHTSQSCCYQLSWFTLNIHATMQRWFLNSAVFPCKQSDSWGIFNKVVLIGQKCQHLLIGWRSLCCAHIMLIECNIRWTPFQHPRLFSFYLAVSLLHFITTAISCNDCTIQCQVYHCHFVWISFCSYTFIFYRL